MLLVCPDRCCAELNPPGETHCLSCGMPLITGVGLARKPLSVPQVERVLADNGYLQSSA